MKKNKTDPKNALKKDENHMYSFLYKRYVQDLFAFGMRFTLDRELVKDCIQDVFTTIYSNQVDLNKIDNIRFYLFASLRNTLFNVFRKENQNNSFSLTCDFIYDPDYTIEEKLIEEETEYEKKKKMIHILELLTPRQKEAIHYRYVEGLKINEICIIMNMNPQSVQNLLQRSIQKVKKKYTNNNHTGFKLKRICV